MGPPMRLPYVEATMQQLKEKQFPRVSWLRTPDPDELQDHLRTDITSKQRVMTFWCTTVFDAVKVVCDSTGCAGVLVMEDTALLRPDVTYTEVAAEVRRKKAPAGVFGYGDRWQKKDHTGHVVGGWWGVKGVWMTPAWCEEMSVIMLNTNFEHLQHVDMWLVGFIRRQKGR